MATDRSSYLEVYSKDPEFMERKRTSNREYMRKRRIENPAFCQFARDYQRDARLKNPIAYLLRGARSRAKTKGVPFDLTLGWAKARWNGKCELTGIEFQQQTGHQGRVLQA